MKKSISSLFELLSFHLHTQSTSIGSPLATHNYKQTTFVWYMTDWPSQMDINGGTSNCLTYTEETKLEIETVKRVEDEERQETRRKSHSFDNISVILYFNFYCPINSPQVRGCILECDEVYQFQHCMLVPLKRFMAIASPLAPYRIDTM